MTSENVRPSGKNGRQCKLCYEVMRGAWLKDNPKCPKKTHCVHGHRMRHNNAGRMHCYVCSGGWGRKKDATITSLAS